MGSATDAQRRQASATSEITASAMDTSSAPLTASPKWRLAQRTLPPTEHDLVLKPVDVEGLHPLKAAAPAAGADQTKSNDTEGKVTSTPEVVAVVAAQPSEIKRVEKESKSRPSNGPTEVVALGEGELDPLGAFAMGLSLDAPLTSVDTNAAVSSSSSSRKANGFTSGDSGTMKQLWTAHKDRLLAKLSDETFTIKASMLETSDIESDISYAASTTEYKRREESNDDPAASSADGVNVIRKTRARLEQLERRQLSVSSSDNSRNNGNNTVEITQRDYVARIKQMEADLVKAWQQNLKVQALRIAIKCVKQLSDTSSAPQMYPVAFVLVSDILDTFGRLVFERIKARGSEDENGQPLPTPLGENFTSDEVNIHAKETCRNWFYKTACIRELLPRIYIEIALLKSYRFLCDGEFPQIVARLSNMIKGVGEPTVALYTRLYLALASAELVSPSEKTAVLSSMYDYFFTFQQYRDNGKLVRFIENQNLSENDYFAVHSPAVEWLMKCIAQGASDDVFDALLDQYREYLDNSMVLKHLCESFGAARYSSNPIAMFQLMRTASSSQYSKCHLYSVLAVQLSNAPSIGGPASGKDVKLRFLNEAWSSITAQEDIEMYMECAAAYMRLIVAHYSHREAMILLKDVVRHLNSATPQELTSKVYNLLGALIENVVYGARRHAEFFTRMIPSGEFLSLMGMFKREASVSVAKKVLQAFVHTQDASNVKGTSLGSMRLHVVGPEAAVAHTLFVLCCRVHDALDSLSTATERQDATKDIVAFISRLGYAKQTKDFQALVSSTSDSELQEEEEALLMLYIDCRSAFYKLEPIKAFLTKYVIALAMRVRERMVASSAAKDKGKSIHLRVDDRRRDFIKSCLAYAHITIPSIPQPFQRLELLVLCAKVSLVHNCVPQMEAFLKSAIMIVADLDYAQVIGDYEASRKEKSEGSDQSSDPVLHALGDLVCVAAFAPSLVDDEPFYFVEALRKALLERMPWTSAAMSSAPDRVKVAGSACRIRVLLLLTQLYAMWGQSRLPSRLDGVDSNDVLYGGEVSFHNRAQETFSSTLEQAIESIYGLASSESMNANEVSSQAELMVELISTVFPYLSLDASTPTEDPDSSSGATLLRKCIVFTHAKLETLRGISQLQQARQATAYDALRKKYTETTSLLHAYLQRVAKKQAPLFSDVARRAIDSLDESLERLTIEG